MSRRLRRAALTGVVVLGFLLVGWWVDEVTAPLEDLAYRPHVQHVSLGQQAELGIATVEVESLEGATTLLTTTGEHMLSPGVWVAATFTLTPAHEPATIGWAELRDAADRSYPALTRNVLRCPLSNPGVPVSCTVAIELPADRAIGAQLLLAEAENADEHVRVDLAITGTDVKTWLDREDSVVLSDSGPHYDGEGQG